jgi:hypothetical protein
VVQKYHVTVTKGREVVGERVVDGEFQAAVGVANELIAEWERKQK